ncbi:uncharacterized protein EDB91DRAFT_1153776 [Suillus paluster]|uniref:uncharacterized protein n=1 Tax=Suillus paluster TaxID=48578 RepID=UPI001B884846|nr:uncharacterized protein EDB91DRAFT_1153776 [Suillus paluster]KAG1731635.1 hypothetical protein EDB91DRAFT_1153776 [Suillus paluster]
MGHAWLRGHCLMRLGGVWGDPVPRSAYYGLQKLHRSRRFPGESVLLQIVTQTRGSGMSATKHFIKTRTERKIEVHIVLLPR